ncbi:MAG: hypothetical protein U9Q38_06440, partial [Thermodesulfobacteriota bacterium]|nr:hypothetical protein [Thermodesulfobacteriota bacterium]
IGRWQPIDINIHELAHKCKEWAYSDGIMLQSYLYNDKARCDIEKFGVFEHEFQVADTEPESIFKACEWILEQLKQKDK